MPQKIFNIYSKIYINSALKEGFKVKVVDPNGLVLFQKELKEFPVYYCLLPCNTSVAASIAHNKNLTNKLLSEKKIPILQQKIVHNEQDLEKLKITFPLTVKPNKGIGGKGVTTLVNTNDGLKKAFFLAQKFHPQVLIEKFHHGENYRLLVVDDKVIACCKRSPPMITGDGKKSVRELIASENKKRERLNKLKKIKTLEKISIDSEVKRTLRINRLNLKTTVQKNKKLYLRENANLSTGGTVIALKESQLHPSFTECAIKATKTIGLKIAGVDIIATDIEKPCQLENASVIEINHNPGIRMHHFPSNGEAVDVASYILNYLWRSL